MAKDWSKHQAQHFQGREPMAKSFRGEDFSGHVSPLDRAGYGSPRGHDKQLSDSDRAHSGQPGAKVKHGADANNQVVRRRPADFLIGLLKDK